MILPKSRMLEDIEASWGCDPRELVRNAIGGGVFF
jgi:hypothetical protein